MKIDFNNYKTFGNLLQKLREQKAVTIRGAAVEIGISAVYLCDLEKGGRKPPKGKVLNDICAYYDLDEEEKEKLKELIEVERLGATKEQLEFLTKNKQARIVVDMLMQIEDFDNFIKKHPQAIAEIQETINKFKEQDKAITK